MASNNKFPQRLLSLAQSLLIGYVALNFTGFFSFFASASRRFFWLSPLDVAASLILASILFLNPNLRRNCRAVGLLSVMLIFYYCVGIANAKHIDGEQEIGKLLSLLVLIFSIPIAISDRHALKLLALGLQCGVVLNSVLCWLQIEMPERVAFLFKYGESSSTFMFGMDITRPAAMLVNPNEMGSCFVVSFICASWAPLAIGAGGRLASILGIYLTVSRTATLLLIVSGVIINLVMIINKFARRNVFLALLIIVPVGLIFSNSILKAVNSSDEETFNRITRVFVGGQNNLEEDRLRLFYYWLPRAIETPIFGEGIYTFQLNDGMGTHNAWLMILGEVGFIGIFLYCMVVFGGLRSLVGTQIGKQDKVLCWLLWVVWFSSTFTSHNHMEYRHLVGLIALILSIKIPLAVTRSKTGLGNSAIESIENKGDFQKPPALKNVIQKPQQNQP